MGHVEPSWTILIPTLGQRAAPFQRLMGVLLPQLDQHGGRVQVVGYWNQGLPRLPTVRQRMVQVARTEYVCFIDDDDLVPDFYVAQVVAALASRPDYVGWQVQCYSSGVPTAISYHSLRHGRWWNEATAYYRDLSHINPIRRDLALLADFQRARPGRAEDRAWVDQLRGTGLVRTEVTIDKIMYHYLYDPRASAWRKPHRIRRGQFHRPVIDHPHFTWHPESPRA